MTLSELIHKVSFDDLIPTIKKKYGVETDIYAYKEAFDELNLLRQDLERHNFEYLFGTYSITESNFRQQESRGGYKPATLYESISKYSLLPQSEYDSVVIVLYSSDAANVSPSLRSAVEEVLITGRSLKRSVLKICSDSRITDGSIRAFVVTSKDEHRNAM